MKRFCFEVFCLLALSLTFITGAHAVDLTPIERLRANPLRTHADMQQAMRDLHEPLIAHYGPGGVHLGVAQANFGSRMAGIEGFLRPWWGLAPLDAGGGEFAHWELIRTTLANSVNPDRPEFWGYLSSPDQRTVEMAALSFGLMVAPEKIWNPLTEQQKKNVVAWLTTVHTCNGLQNNWVFFRILSLCALRSVGAPIDAKILESDLAIIDQQYLGDGWYSDGPTARRDYYIPMAMHYYGLLYSVVAGKDDPVRAKRFRERAAKFAEDFQHWFTPAGDALPYGRSLTYRFAQSAFWSAIAYADVEVKGLSRGQIKGLLLRNLRWWFQQPIFSDGGILTVGYRYPNYCMAEPYNSCGSPYWASKTFIAIALPASHPFWQATEEPLPIRATISVQPLGGYVFSHDDRRSHTIALTGGQDAPWLNASENKYGKFAYSTHFGFCVAGNTSELSAGFDSTLALSDEEHRFRTRASCEVVAIIAPSTQYSLWKPWSDVLVESWIAPHGFGHVRIHHIRTPRALTAVECGFSLDRDVGKVDMNPPSVDCAWMSNAFGVSAVRGLHGNWTPKAVQMDPNLNVLNPLVVVPMLESKLSAGEHWLASVVVGIPGQGQAASEATTCLKAVEWGGEDGVPCLKSGGSALLRAVVPENAKSLNLLFK